MKDTEKNIEHTENSKAKNTKKSRKKSTLIRILIMVPLLCAVVFATIIVSDFVSDNRLEDNTDLTQAQTKEPEYITIKISGSTIFLDSEKVSIYELREFLESKAVNGNIPDVALINDTESPADHTIYNEVSKLLGEYGKNIGTLSPASHDEFPLIATNDEI